MNFVKNFFNKDDLPMHSGSRSNNGVRGIPVVDKAVAFSLFWALLSIALVLVGWFHCSANAFSYTVACGQGNCVWKTTNSSIPSISFLKSDLIDADVVRVDENGMYADSDRMKDKKARYGYSVRLKARLPLEDGSKLKTEKAFMFAPYDLGRRVSKSAVTNIRAFRDNRNEAFNYTRGKSITALGIVCVFTGLVSLLLSCLFGQWMEISPRRMKKAS